MQSSEKSEQLRVEAKEVLKNINKNDLSLIWLLGEIDASQVYKSWGFASFRKWYEEESTGSPSLSHAYALARIGKNFSGQKADIERQVGEGRITIRQLMDLASRREAGEQTEVIVEKILHPENLPKRDEDVQNDSERPMEFKFYIPRGDRNNVLCGLIMEALAAQVSSLSDAIRGRAIENWNVLINDGKLAQYDKYRSLIQDGKFFCAACRKVPLNPTLHHILPVSIGRGYGPQALLCWEPCHEQTVQKHWRVWANRWGKRYGFTVEMLKTEAERQIATGTVDTDCTILITGDPLGIGK